MQTAIAAGLTVMATYFAITAIGMLAMSTTDGTQNLTHEQHIEKQERRRVIAFLATCACALCVTGAVAIG